MEDEGGGGFGVDEGLTGVDEAGGVETGVDDGVDGIEDEDPPSRLQSALHPSPSKLLPSSHSSPFSGSKIPFPQTPLQLSLSRSQTRLASVMVGKLWGWGVGTPGLAMIAGPPEANSYGA